MNITMDVLEYKSVKTLGIILGIIGINICLSVVNLLFCSTNLNNDYELNNILCQTCINTAYICETFKALYESINNVELIDDCNSLWIHCDGCPTVF